MDRKIFLLLLAGLLVISTACSKDTLSTQTSNNSNLAPIENAPPSVEPEKPKDYKLTENFSDEDEHLSLQYPKDWSSGAFTNLLKEYYDFDEVFDFRIMMLENNNMGDLTDKFSSYISIFSSPHYGFEHEIELVFTSTKDNFPYLLNTDSQIESITDATIDGAQARIVEYSMPIKNTSNTAWCKRYYYAVESDLYWIDFICLEKYWERYTPLFDAIMNTYKITSAMKRTAATSINTSAPVSSKLLTVDEAQQYVERWIELNPLGGEVGLELDNDYVCFWDKTKEFYAFDVRLEDEFIITVCVDRTTGELLGDSEEMAEPLDQWYEWYQGAVLAGEDEDDYIDADTYGDLGFDRAAYFTGITRNDLLRYPDQYVSKKIHLIQYAVTSVPSIGKYIAKYNNVFGDGNYITVDASAAIGPNLTVNDKFSLYGTFQGSTTLTFTNGRSETVPVIHADKIILNSVLPNNIDEFARAIAVSSANNPKLVAPIEYISDTTLKIVCKMDGYHRWFVGTDGIAGGLGFVDGYYVTMKNNSFDVSHLNFPDDKSKNQEFVLTGKITSVRFQGVSTDVVVQYEIEDIEPYNR